MSNLLREQDYLRHIEDDAFGLCHTDSGGDLSVVAVRFDVSLTTAAVRAMSLGFCGN